MFHVRTVKTDRKRTEAVFDNYFPPSDPFHAMLSKTSEENLRCASNAVRRAKRVFVGERILSSIAPSRESINDDERVRADRSSFAQRFAAISKHSVPL